MDARGLRADEQRLGDLGIRRPAATSSRTSHSRAESTEDLGRARGDWRTANRRCRSIVGTATSAPRRRRRAAAGPAGRRPRSRPEAEPRRARPRWWPLARGAVRRGRASRGSATVPRRLGTAPTRPGTAWGWPRPPPSAATRPGPPGRQPVPLGVGMGGGHGERRRGPRHRGKPLSMVQERRSSRLGQPGFRGSSATPGPCRPGRLPRSVQHQPLADQQLFVGVDELVQGLSHRHRASAGRPAGAPPGRPPRGGMPGHRGLRRS